MTHGTDTGYRYHRCRCEACTQAHREANRGHIHNNPSVRSAKARADRAYYERNKARKAEYDRRRRDQASDEQKAKLKESQVRYRTSEKGRAVVAAYVAAYRARKRNAPGSASPTQIQSRFDYYGGKCYLRLEGCTSEGTTIDHVIPLSRGGSNWPSNLRPACGSCNYKKRGRTPQEVAA